MIIKPLTKKNGEVYTNVEINNMCYDELVKLRDGVGAKTERERKQMEDQFYRICGGSENADEIMKFMQQIKSCDNEDKAQDMFARGLIGQNVKRG